MFKLLIDSNYLLTLICLEFLALLSKDIRSYPSDEIKVINNNRTLAHPYNRHAKLEYFRFCHQITAYFFHSHSCQVFSAYS